MRTYYKYKGKLVDVEKHFNGVCEIVTDKSLVLLLNNFGGKKYIPLNKIVFQKNKSSKNLPMVVKQPHPMDRPNRIGKVKDLLEDDGRDYYGF